MWLIESGWFVKASRHLQIRVSNLAESIPISFMAKYPHWRNQIDIIMMASIRIEYVSIDNVRISIYNTTLLIPC